MKTIILLSLILCGCTKDEIKREQTLCINNTTNHQWGKWDKELLFNGWTGQSYQRRWCDNCGLINYSKQ